MALRTRDWGKLLSETTPTIDSIAALNKETGGVGETRGRGLALWGVEYGGFQVGWLGYGRL